MKPIDELINYGILVMDKPADWTSHDVVAFVRGCLKVKKVGHLGTLDPMVTGVLPLVLGKATKLSHQLMRKDKTYIGTMALHEEVSEKDLEKEMKKHVGTITQLPPVKSRVKREEREREVYEFKIHKFHKKKVEFIAKVEAGTYIRKLIHDLGENIGGAHMTALKRTQAGFFDEKQMIKMDDFKDAVSKWRQEDPKDLQKMIIPADEVLESIKGSIIS